MSAAKKGASAPGQIGTFQCALDKLPVGILITDLEGSLIFVNDWFQRLSGVATEMLSHDRWLDTFTKLDTIRIQTFWDTLKESKTSFRGEFHFERTDGSKRLADLQGIYVPDLGFMLYANDITTNRQIQQALEQSERRLGTILENMHDGVVVQNEKGEIIMSNPAAEKILGLTAEQMAGRTSIDHRWRTIHEDHTTFPGEEHPATVVLRGESTHESAIMGVHKPNDEITWINVSAVPLVNDQEDSHHGVIATFTDVTKIKETEEELNNQIRKLHLMQIEVEMRQKELQLANDRLRAISNTDVLTGLNNRRCLFDRLDAEFSLSSRYELKFSFLLIDIDHFKSLNDSFGHQAGDFVLQQIAQKLSEQARASDFVARYGGEEFAIILPNTTTAEAEKIANRILTAVRSIRWKRELSVSIGVAEFGRDANTIDELVEKADKALYLAKESGRNTLKLAA